MLTNTRRIALAVVTACAIFGLHNGDAHAQILITVDENGNGSVGGNPLTGVLLPEPSNRNVPALTYTFNLNGNTLTTGDLQLLEPAEGNGILSEVIRFEVSGTGSGSLVFYSDFSASIPDRKSTRLNSSHLVISYAVFCLKKKKTIVPHPPCHLHAY